MYSTKRKQVFYFKGKTKKISRFLQEICSTYGEDVYKRQRDNHPDVAVDVQMGSVEEVYHWVQEDKADMCFASWQEWFTLDWTHLRNDPLLVILPPDYDMQGRESLKVQSLQGMDFLMPSPGFYLDRCV